MGYERYRELVLERQKEMGIVPESTALPPVNPIGTPADTKSPTGLPFPQVDYTRPWDSLSAEEKRLFSRMAEVYAIEIFLTPRPKMTKPHDRYVYYPNTAEVPESAAVSIVNRSFAIRAEVEIPAGGAEGVIFNHGSRFGGHALYVKDGKLHYVYNWVGITEQKVSSSKPVSAGGSTLSAIFTKEGENPPHVANGTLAIYIDMQPFYKSIFIDGERSLNEEVQPGFTERV